MENRYLFLMTGALVVLFAYFTAASLIDNKVACSQDDDCSLVQTSCCADENSYSCFESNYALLLKAQNLKCPLMSNGNCTAYFKTPPECACVQKQCATREKNESAFNEQLERISNSSRPTEQNAWGQ
jgi:hypothetical protein